MQQDQLIAELQQKNERAFERIYQLYSVSTYGIIFSITKDEKVSEEILQDVFMKIWNNASSYNPEKGRFFTWVLNIARNASIDKIRSKDFKNKRLNLKSDNFVDILESKSNTSGKLDAIGLQKYLDILEPTCKKLIDLLFFKGFTQKETAEELAMPLGTVKTRNRVCIDKLRSTVI
ncbi:sigma-70 family RNA polymerase sigma factor [Gillisia sp. M10.2A]|uniref:Sigma-70 family RNA polymerase sigma factor n=1 Tax=Gillisia lutea TaxID=2909668 RepID=A0ABS9EG32_9FLAO|nr:sigma-70 family RNA polymerase sigma factor [Gillisia lutea]MCF4101822.1 sigma-70 family RNA polymerase sigma factor [Gillisia lutea]